MIKRVLLLSSLMLSVPTWAATQPAAESAPVAKASDTATTATTAAQGANALKESDGKDIIARDPKPNTTLIDIFLDPSGGELGTDHRHIHALSF